MILSLILGAILGAALVVFALQNVAVVTLTFFSWQFEGSLALVVLLAALLGMVVTLLVVLPESIASYFSYRSLRNTNAKLAEDLRVQKELNSVAARNAEIESERLLNLRRESTI